ncbi:MAG TPA: hypothetical protein VMI75_28375 [Polyangiaceae bacterium]|nr:hypothetical protein [Polyangiaceae bacterium]
MDPNNKPSTRQRFTAVVAGIQKGNLGNVTINGVAYTPASLGAVFTSAVTDIDDADGAKVTWQGKVQVKKASVKNANVVYRLLRQYLLAQNGEQATTTLGLYGMEPPKPRTTTPAVKAAAAVKAEQTRAMRHTQSKKQKKDIKSNAKVTITATPATGADSPAQGSQPSAPIASPAKPPNGG